MKTSHTLRGQTSGQNFVSQSIFDRHERALDRLVEYGVPADLRAQLSGAARELLALANPAGISRFGEDLVAAWVGGEVAANYKDGHDVVASNGALIEVKFSKLNTPVKGKPTRRWNWANITGGEAANKDCDFIVLVGEADPRFADLPLIDNLYVAFCIPHEHVKGNYGGLNYGGNRGQINVTSNPDLPFTAAMIRSYALSREGFTDHFKAGAPIFSPPPIPEEVARARGRYR
ncbi:hypothetical protein [Brevundimonas guildfordensis]|uniref:Restriction endonuclease n=1 Tax=Brevundimonas guildfordensis TaxID=2762241 RepID=A0ABR8R491_9CAUL|nr:hypothetical protein [Brevundimonas guildfordensis]MBD7942492.1 hypothetical protein [Brevundimonas guildfordensis]